MFRIYLRVVSETLSPEGISARLRVRPDSSAAKGSRTRPEYPVRASTSWTREISDGRSNARPEELEPVVLGWGMEFAQDLGKLVLETDAVVALVVVQEFDDLEDGRSKGISMSADLINWLSTARACVDIDQYIFHECPVELHDE